jgi:hypothetical protein
MSKSKRKTKLKVIWDLLTNKYNHWIIIQLSDEDVVNLIKEEGFDVSTHYYGLQRYNCQTIFKGLGESIDDSEMLLSKAKYEAEASTRSKI